MSELRARIAERLSLEILEYVIEEIFSGADLSAASWIGIKEPDLEMLRALGALEREELSYDDLEAVGVRYVEGWERIID